MGVTIDGLWKSYVIDGLWKSHGVLIRLSQLDSTVSHDIELLKRDYYDNHLLGAFGEGFNVTHHIMTIIKTSSNIDITQLEGMAWTSVMPKHPYEIYCTIPSVIKRDMLTTKFTENYRIVVECGVTPEGMYQRLIGKLSIQEFKDHQYATMMDAYKKEMS